MLLIKVKGPLTRAASGAVRGHIYFEASDGWTFPERDWLDFVDVVLQWWLTEINQGHDEMHLMFMDGPFEVVVHRLGLTCRLMFSQRTATGLRVLREFTSPYAEVVEQVRVASRIASALVAELGSSD